MGFRAVWAEADERQQLKSVLIPAAALTFFVFGSQRLLNLDGLLFPNTTDLYPYAFDGSLGFQPSFVMGRLFRDYPGVGTVGRFTYDSLATCNGNGLRCSFAAQEDRASVHFLNSSWPVECSAIFLTYCSQPRVRYTSPLGFRGRLCLFPSYIVWPCERYL
jgi:hypothetical protein